jgi:hypothetical protein
MGEVHIKAKDLSRMLKRRLHQDQQALERVALEVVIRAETAAVTSTNDKGLVDRFTFKNSWEHRQIKGGAELGNTAPYADVIEYGRRPNRPGPPLAPILAWVERKLVANGEVAPDEAKHVAILIRQHIHTHGTKPKGVLRGVFAQMKGWFREAARRELARTTIRSKTA